MPKPNTEDVKLLCVGFAYTGPLQVDLKLRDPESGLLPYIQEADQPLDALKDFLRSIPPKDPRKPVVIATSVREFHRVFTEGLHLPGKRRPGVHAFVLCDDTVALQQVPKLPILDLAPGEPGQGWRSRKVQVRDLLRALHAKGSVPAGTLGPTRPLGTYFTQPITAKELIDRLEQSLSSHIPNVTTQLAQALLCTMKESAWTALRKRLLALSQDNDSVMEFEMFIGTDTASSLRAAHQYMSTKGKDEDRAAKKASANLTDLIYLVSLVPPKEGTVYHLPKTRKGRARDAAPAADESDLQDAE